MINKILKFGLLFHICDAVEDSKKDSEKRQKCRALALRGGGTKGNYQVGVLQSFLDNLPPEEIQYDVVVGVSIGAINAATIGQFDKGEEKAAFVKLREYWGVLKTDQIFVNWPTWGPLSGFWRNSFFDGTPSHTKVNERLPHNMKRKVAFQSVDINDGTVYNFDENLEKHLQGEAVAASASIPVVLQPTKTIGPRTAHRQLVDGGTFSDLNLQNAIQKCRELVDDDEDIIVDVIMCQSEPIEMKAYKPWSLFNFYRIIQRQKDFRGYYKSLNDVLVVATSNPKIKYRYIVTATENLPGSAIPILVKKEELEETFQIGYKDGIKAIQNDTAFVHMKDQIKDYEYYTLREGFD